MYGSAVSPATASDSPAIKQMYDRHGQQNSSSLTSYKQELASSNSNLVVEDTIALVPHPKQSYAVELHARRRPVPAKLLPRASTFKLISCKLQAPHFCDGGWGVHHICPFCLAEPIHLAPRLLLATGARNGTLFHRQATRNQSFTASFTCLADSEYSFLHLESQSRKILVEEACPCLNLEQAMIAHFKLSTPVSDRPGEAAVCVPLAMA